MEHGMSAPTLSDTRRYDLDWLRVIAFGFLIFYHIGMFYVTWDWHVKSPFASHVLEPVMRFINPWRLPLLFFISGVALKFVMDKLPARKFVPQKLARLGIPILFGFFVFVTPQAYYELLAKGETGPDYLAFWWQYVDFDFEFSILTPTYNHLWYVVYILLYTLILVPLRPVLEWLRGPFDRLFAGRGGVFLLLVPVIPFIAYDALWSDAFPVTHAIVDDWFNHANSLTMVVFGYLAAKSPAFWQAVDRARHVALAVALVTGGVRLAASLSWIEVPEAVLSLKRIVFTWAVIAAMLGFGQRHLNRTGPVLRYLTDAVFPYYILHQTLIVCLGVWCRM
jgi:glucans biosynthesis protein C